VTHLDENEASIVRLGLRSMALEDGASPGQVVGLQSDGETPYFKSGGADKPYVDQAVAGSQKVHGPFTFAYNAEGLSSGIPFFSPTIGDLLIDVLIDVEIAWDGATPQADVGPADGGFFQTQISPVDVTATATGLGVRRPSGAVLGSLSAAQAKSASLGGGSLLPAVWTDDGELEFWVSQDGTRGGADPGATQGLAHVYLVTATPVPW
jgi:hypothetical protein